MRRSRSEDVLVSVEGAENIEGLTFRRIKGKPDFEALAEVIQKSRDADLIQIVDTAEDLERDFRILRHCVPQKDMLYIEADGRLVGYCRCDWHRRNDGLRTYEHSVNLLPDWRIGNLRRALLRENERRLKAIAKRHIQSCRKLFEVRANWADNSWKDLIEDEGYRPFRHNLQLIRPLKGTFPEASLPEGLEIRPYKPKDLRKIYYAAAEAFKEEPNYSEDWWTEDALKSSVDWRGFMPDIWVTAWKGVEVAGGVMNVIDEEENARYGRSWGYIAMVFVRKPYRRRGLARALIVRSCEVLMNQGMKFGALGVDSENPSGARRIYDGLGFRQYDDYVRYTKSVRL
jgi:mycothiol synthase